ncbi:glycine zipper 2TM domain-containing protein [Luteimonas sp. SJ-92]|uniref:Glycine zipper 2TM domain-containing protein n=1 Tax=Luteimonas salinisoli TaxID=2752307 RepID=A0A853JAE5_9GAMM|nr:glycine zipper 2TM domain-containing protein [Luteimonas salinisoli]NZA25639.1 glycine zipper 2TM domain-containing protein [Luteimonas salinisoli]
MNAIRTMLCLGTLAFAGSVAAQAPAPQPQPAYGPQDEGRRFDDGSRVVCQEVEVQRNSNDPNRVGGTVAGAVIGGLVGNQVGSGDGRKLATAGGAVAGGAIGRKVQGDRQETVGDRIVETRCERVWR